MGVRVWTYDLATGMYCSRESHRARASLVLLSIRRICTAGVHVSVSAARGYQFVLSASSEDTFSDNEVGGRREWQTLREGEGEASVPPWASEFQVTAGLSRIFDEFESYVVSPKHPSCLSWISFFLVSCVDVFTRILISYTEEY